MSQAVDITAVLNAHTEGVLAGPSIVNFEQEIERARCAGLTVEGLIVLDRPDLATRLQFEAVKSRHKVIITDHGDLGLSRNSAVTVANGAFIAFLDGDDIWGQDWLVAAHQFCTAEPDVTIAHPEAFVLFGEARQMWWHVDSRDPAFDPDYLRFGNYWDSLSFASCAIYRRYPFGSTDLRRGFGYEDWHWNCVTLAAGIDHRPVADTLHFKRRRRGSLVAQSKAANAIPWITPIASYGWTVHNYHKEN